MAKAMKVPSDYDVTLTLSRQESEVLLHILNCIGGDPGKSPRGLADAIRAALEGVGVAYRSFRNDTTTRGIYFDDQPV